MNKIKYPPETAGKIMIENVPLVSPEETILDAKRKLFKEIEKFETINYVYVVEKNRKLLGVLSIKEIFRKPEKTKMKDIMKRNLIVARPYTDQERVAILALRNNLKAIPVVDKEGKFLGVVPSDIILDVLHLEHVEDILKLGGIPKTDALPENLIKTPSGVLAKIRLPWLILGLLGGILAAQIVSSFENSLKTNFILAAFIPLIVYIADAVGTQTETLTIRNLAFDTKISFKKYLLKEINTGILIAVVLGGLFSLISVFWQQQPFYIGLILGISLFLTVISAILIGFLIPYLLQKFKKDPAIGSGPFATIITDICSLAIYFSVASLLLKLL